MQKEKEKQKTRQNIWKLLERQEIAKFPRPVFGRIPNFEGVKKATENLCNTVVYERAKCIFANPDAPQHVFREKALQDGKKVIMATPGIRKGFLKLNPSKIPENQYHYATTIKGSFKFGSSIPPSNLHIDLFMAGSVAVSTKGGRLGKGKGYTDLEYAIVHAFEAFSREFICTTVHEVQVLEQVPMDQYDLPVDLIATPQQTIHTETEFPRPTEINWALISQERINTIPLLQELQEQDE